MKHFLTLAFVLIMFLIAYLLLSTGVSASEEIGARIVDFLFGLAAIVIDVVFILKTIREPFALT